MLDQQAIKTELGSNKISYLSYTLFENSKPLMYYCSNSNWLNHYNNYYDKDIKEPPVQKHILSTKNRVIAWDLLYLDQETQEYLDKRNKVVGVKSNLSIISRKRNFISVLTIGSKEEEDFLINFSKINAKHLLEISKNLLINQSY
ncbi:MAG: hypothetical protein EOP34_02850 [Rickettsiales bacterium]|nr:MAG: hypothetical protein EOP34_02850 [Rickettsiales bacterium]